MVVRMGLVSKISWAGLLVVWCTMVLTSLGRTANFDFSGSISLKNSKVTSCSFISVPPTPLKCIFFFSTVMTGSLVSIRQMVRMMCFGLWAHVQLG